MIHRPSVGVGVLVVKDEQVLLLRRKNAHGAGSWSPPGGHLEFGESLKACATRETQEETGLIITDVRFRALTNDVFEAEGKHYVTLWMQGIYVSGEATLNAPYEASEIGWFPLHDLPKPLFLPLENLLTGKNTYRSDTGRTLMVEQYAEQVNKAGKKISSAPMASAPMLYTESGQVAWDEMWTNFCDLALDGGPAHRDRMLEPVPVAIIQANMEGYEQVLAEIERGLHLVTKLPILHTGQLGWIGLVCKSEEMADWLVQAILVENVRVRREGAVLYLPVGPDFRLEKEIKNVITVAAKTNHYWIEHLTE